VGERDDIRGILVTLKVGNDQALFVMLGADGSINRMGTGSVNNTELDMFIGRTSPEVFHQLRGRVTEALLGWCGQSLSAPEKRGKVCTLTVGFQIADGQERITAWEYGSESQGPPPEVCDFVVAAVETTTPWYEQQKTIVSRRGQEGGKKWWQFWK
jgi:hypothetical protein